MKRILTILGLTVALAARADITITTNRVGGMVPDNNLSGWADTLTVSGFSGYTVSDVNVLLDLSGGWNGDLYAYLVHDTGFSVLLNRVGVTGSSAAGFGDAGLNITLDDAAVANGNIHSYGAGTIAGGALWQPDGRNISPLTAGGTLFSTPSTAILSSFNGLNPDGNWSLFVADVNLGGITTVQNWGLKLTLTAIPEPMTASLVLAAAGILFLHKRRQAAR